MAAELCGRPQEPPAAMFERLTKAEKLGENFRDKSYVAVNDAAKGTVWTFTVPGHPAHPSVVCRRPVQEGAQMRLEMNVQCNAAEAECQKLVQGFQELNQRMIREEGGVGGVRPRTTNASFWLPRRGQGSDPVPYDMNSSSDPSGSRK